MFLNQLVNLALVDGVLLFSKGAKSLLCWCGAILNISEKC